MSIARRAINLFDTVATLHEIETYLWLHNVGLHICAESIRERVQQQTKLVNNGHSDLRCHGFICYCSVDLFYEHFNER